MRFRFSLLAACLLAGCFATTTDPSAPVPSASASAAAASGLTTLPIGGPPVALAAAGSLVYTAIQGAATMSLIDTRNLDPAGRFDLAGSQPTIGRTFLDRRQILAIDEAKNELLVIDVGLAPPVAPASEDPNAPRPSGPAPTLPSPSPSRPSVLHRLPIGEGVGSFALTEDNLGVLMAPDAGGTMTLFTFPEDRRLPPTSKAVAFGGAGATGAHDLVDLKGGTWLAVRGDKLITGELAGGAVRELTMVDPAMPDALGTKAGKPIVAIGIDPKGGIALADVAPGGATTTITGAGTGPRELVVDPDKRRLYVSMAGSNEVAVIDYEGKKLLTRLPAGRAPTAISLAAPLPGEVWVASEDDQLTVIDGSGAMPKVKATRPLGKGPHKLTFWGTKGYVSNQADGTVTVVDRTTMR